LPSFKKEAGIKLEDKHEYTVAGGRADSVYPRVVIEYKKSYECGGRLLTAPLQPRAILEFAAKSGMPKGPPPKRSIEKRRDWQAIEERRECAKAKAQHIPWLLWSWIGGTETPFSRIFS